MMQRGWYVLVLVVAGAAAARAAGPEAPGVARVALSSSLVEHVPAMLVPPALQPFQALLEAQTGVAGQCLVVPADELADQLATGKVDVGVFQGYEFAWARLKAPNLVPLVIAVNPQRYLLAQVVVSSKSRVANLAGLRQGSLALPQGSRGHCLLYLDRECQAGGAPYQRYFARIDRPASVEDALDDVVDGTTDAALVDGLALECYQRRKPGRFSQLRVLERSPLFPAPVLACRPGAFAPATQRRFQDGLQAASQNPQGRRLLQLWKLTGFEPVPDDYAQVLADIARAYPPR